MGLAPYGTTSPVYEKLRRLLRINEDGSGDVPYRISPRQKAGTQDTWAESYLRMAAAVVDRASWDTRGKMDKAAADIAWATQRVAEEAVLATARWAKRNVGDTNLLLAGGVALNAKINMEIFYSGLFNDIFVFPGANDAGGPIGAACYVYEKVLGGKMVNRRLTDVYLGPEYGDDEVARVVKDSKWSSVSVGDGMEEVAKLMTAGKIVGIYQGRAELGPRALGDRSIVADPTKKEMWGTVNQIKGREWWRPLAPSLIDAKRYFVGGKPHEFMVMMYKFIEEAGEEGPGSPARRRDRKASDGGQRRQPGVAQSHRVVRRPHRGGLDRQHQLQPGWGAGRGDAPRRPEELRGRRSRRHLHAGSADRQEVT